MDKIQKNVAYVLIAIFGALASLETYARIWEKRQPEQYISEAVVKSIDPYSSDNDLHLSSRGFRVFIPGEERPIDFPLKNWDGTVQEGDTVDIVVRKSFSWFGLKDELDGLFIDDYK